MQRQLMETSRRNLTKDIKRVAEHVILHIDKPQNEPMRGSKLPWSYIRFAAWAIPILKYHGYIGSKDDEAPPTD